MGEGYIKRNACSRYILLIPSVFWREASFPHLKKKKALNGPFVPLQSVLCGKVRRAWEVEEKAGTHGDNTQTHTLSHTHWSVWWL